MAEAPRTPLPSGYDEDFANVVDDDFQCLICHLPLKEPVQTRCGHRFCKECLQEHFRRQGAQDQPLTCPADREGLDRDRDVFPDKATERKILSFAIKCPSEGCEWTGELRSKEVHLASCLFKLVFCTNENCHVTVQMRHLEEHVTTTCLWRILECDHCSEPHPECKMQDHIAHCSKFPVTCLNICGASIPREMIPNHTEYDCPLTIISCPYEKMGCETKVQRVQMESHLQSAMRLHLDLACVTLNNTEVKLNDTETKLNDARVKLNDAHVKLNDTQIKLNDTQVKLNETEKKLETTRKVVEKLDTRIFIWRINNFSGIWKQAKMEKLIRRDSSPFYTDRIESYGYKLKLTVAANGLGSSPFMWVFIVVMKGEYDAILPWPFENKVRLTVIDQQEDLVRRQNITSHLIRNNNPEAFARPVEEENKEVMFPIILTSEGLNLRRYVVDDTLFLQVEISPL